MRMVPDVIENWQAMDGSSPLVKQLNALLTAAFIGRYDVPSDECMSNATSLISSWYACQMSGDDGGWDELATNYLRSRFVTGERVVVVDNRAVSIEPTAAPELEPVCVQAAHDARLLFMHVPLATIVSPPEA